MQQLIEPPLYFAQDHIFDAQFHPHQDILACALVTGAISILKYDSENVVEIAQLNHHQQSARLVQFFPDGQYMLSASKDQSFALIDQNGKVIWHKQMAHNSPINTAKLLDHLVFLGDDDGCIKVWDLRQQQCVYKVKDVEEGISKIEIDPTGNFMISSSLDGYLSIHDLRVQCQNEKCLYARSDCMEEDLTDLALVKGSQFICTSTSEGNLLLFKWDYFGDFKDRIIGHPNSIDSIIKIDENTIITGAEDGLLRGVSIFPNNIVGVLGQHEEEEFFPISKVSVDRNKQIAATLSHDSSIKFHDISQFVHKRKNAQVWNNEDEYVFMNSRKQKQEKSEMMEEKIEEKEEEEDSEESEDDWDSEDERQQKQKQKSYKQRSVKSSVQNLKKQKIKQFFDKL